MVLGVADGVRDRLGRPPAGGTDLGRLCREPFPTRAERQRQTRRRPPASSPTSACRSPSASLVHVLERTSASSSSRPGPNERPTSAGTPRACLDVIQGAPSITYRAPVYYGASPAARSSPWAPTGRRSRSGAQRIIHRRPSPLRAAISGGKITAMETDWATIEINGAPRIIHRWPSPANFVLPWR